MLISELDAKRLDRLERAIDASPADAMQPLARTILSSFRRRRPDVALADIDHGGGERHEQRRLRHRQRFRDGAVTQSDGVKEVGRAECERGNANLDERLPG